MHQHASTCINMQHADVHPLYERCTFHPPKNGHHIHHIHMHLSIPLDPERCTMLRYQKVYILYTTYIHIHHTFSLSNIWIPPRGVHAKMLKTAAAASKAASTATMKRHSCHAKLNVFPNGFGKRKPVVLEKYGEKICFLKISEFLSFSRIFGVILSM